MPHKRAKRSVRDQQRSQNGTDLAPGRGTHTQDDEPLPKSFLRALNADKVQAEFRAKRKLRYEGGAGDESGEKVSKRRKVDSVADAKIRRGETLAHFNKRIEADMRPLFREAVQASRATQRAVKKKKCPKTSSGPVTTSRKPTKQPSASNPPVDRHAHRPKEFLHISASAPRRLNDIAIAPPNLSSSVLARKASDAQKGSGKKAKAETLLSPAQALQMAKAREEAVARYRELKEKRRREAGQTPGEDEGDVE
ncbi:hypothetical protein FB45DRAFT_796407 [Roridomyces roridus]|uniref:Uncharacterized protein n=1 Tax=Roridomyces roridus TaxID=1738132 RepID=A0AAD7BL36_9AGAR|nr:hypothetical protein FB45DRAFT_796407 [Roridomyces roridus]